MIALAVLAPSGARADSLCPSYDRLLPTRGSSRRWPPPMDRVVSLHGRDLSLRAALDHVAAAARVRFSYTAELLPLDVRVCTEFDSVAVGDVLRVLLRGVNVEPVAVGPDQVVLAPARARADTLSAEPVGGAHDGSPGVLDRVVVTGSTAGTSERPLSVALDVVGSRQLVERGATTFSAALDGSVPGVWIWEQSPSSLLARYASIRGASSFGVNYPKVYIDGVEVANPLLLTRFFPDVIDRIEVIRGPQGAALYGADAISGVINVVTRHEGVGPDGRRAQVQSSAGMSRTDFNSSGAFVQRQTLLMRAGSSERSAGFGVSASSIGAFIPDGASRQLAANAEARVIGARTGLTVSGRLTAEHAGPAVSPLLADWITARTAVANRPMNRPLAIAPTESQSINQYTLGANGTFIQNGRWTHGLVAGVDGYRLSNVVVNAGPVPSATDSALRAARGSAARGTFRASSVGQFGDEERAGLRLTLAAEHSALREATAANFAREPFGGPLFRTEVTWRENTGLTAQANVALHNTYFVTAGSRLERNSGYTSSPEVSWLPMLGVAYVREVGRATLKLRSAYGKGIRPPQTSIHQEGWRGFQATTTSSNLSPEVQSGVEGGLDLLFGRAFTFHLTRFDQAASGLIQSVPVVADSQAGGPPGRRIAYALQNVGEISNRGWELQGSAQRGALALSGALSSVQSRVERVIAGYTGDLQAGDRMLEVPARTASISASWSDAPWLLSLGVSRASDWINYDRLALTQDLATSSRQPGTFLGQQLRAYWRQYGGNTRLRASLSRDLMRLTLVLSGENLLNQQRGEPDNVTVVPGRTLTGGLRIKF